MAQDCFAKGVEAFYKDHWGHISFVSEEYITLCIHSIVNWKSLYMDNNGLVTKL